MQKETRPYRASQLVAVPAAVLLGFTCLTGCLAGPPESTSEARSNASSTGIRATCGNGLIDAGETCASCPADCAPSPCAKSTEQATFGVRISVPLDDPATSITTRLAYDPKSLHFPGNGLTPEAQQRIRNRPKGAATYASALASAVRVVQTKSDGLPSGEIYRVVFDRCKDAPSTAPADLTCTVEGCAGKFGLVDGCSCTVVSGAQDVLDRGSKTY